MFLALYRRIFGSKDAESIEPLYQALCAEARRPAYYKPPYSVPDSFDGRFEMLVAVVQIALFRLGNRVDGGDAQLEAEQHRTAKRRGQALFDRLFADFDRELRESGFGDSAVPKQIQKMADSFFGRGAAYHGALAAQDDGALADALRSNLFATAEVDAQSVLAMAHHLIDLSAGLAARSDQDIMAGNL